MNLVEEKEDGAIRFIHAENKLSGFPINRTNSIRCMVEGPGHTMLVGTIEGLITFLLIFGLRKYSFYLNLPRPQAADGLCSADVMSVYERQMKLSIVIVMEVAFASWFHQIYYLMNFDSGRSAKRHLRWLEP